MKTAILLSFLIVTNTLSQMANHKTINELMLESDYSKVIQILEEKEAHNEILSYNDKFYFAVSYQRLINHRKAINILSLLNKEKPNDVAISFALAESYRMMGNFRIASNIYQRIIKGDSTNVMAIIELAKLSISTKDFKSAKDNFQHLVLFDSTNSYYLQQYGFSLYKLGEDEKAEKYLKDALVKNKHDAKAALWLAKIYFDKEEYEKAFEIIKASAKFNSYDLQLNKLAAEVYFKMKKYKSASAQYLNVIVLGDSSSTIFQKLGLSLYSSVATRDSISDEKKEEALWEAIDALKNSLVKEEVKNPLTLTYLGFSYKTLGQYHKSVFYLEEALNAIAPEYIDKIYSTLGTSYELLDNYNQSIISYSKSLEYNNENPYFVFRLATLYDRYYADKSVALAHYKKYLRTNIDGDEKLIKYAADSVERLRTEIHFRQ